jgi:tRNA pseudouridine55 synthase
VAAYEKARKNETVELQPVPVTVRELQVLTPAESGERRAENGQRPADSEQRSLLRLRVVATSGFYVRSLAHDLGQRLGCGAHLEALRRTRAGQFLVADAATLDRLHDAGAAAADRLVPLNTLLAGLPAVTLTGEGLRRVSNGNTLAPQHAALGFPALPAGARVRVLGATGDVLAVAEQRADGLLHPLLVLR